MAFDLTIFQDSALKEPFLDWLIQSHWPTWFARFHRLWEYYQNRLIGPVSFEDADGRCAESARPYIQAQEMGLPPRITGRLYDSPDGINAGKVVRDIRRKEVVVENDIAWRISAMVDFLFGKGVFFVSRAPNASRRRAIQTLLEAVFEANGGPAFFQDLAVLGAVYGFVDCIIRPGARLNAHLQAATPGRSVQTPDASVSLPRIRTFASEIALDLVEAPRALPVLEEDDCRTIRYYIQHFLQERNEPEQPPALLERFFRRRSVPAGRRKTAVTEIIGPRCFQRYEDFQCVAEGLNPLGYIPVVHIQNLSQPYAYEGISDVEQLIGLQDELNTRLSDRANRLTMQAFRMYLAKGIEGVGEKPVSPGRMWCTDNENASIQEFGGDDNCPSENLHILDIRDAMDKISGVTPVVAGVLKNKIGHLTSGVALKMTFMGMLTRNSRKQYTYGQGLRRMAEIILDIFNRAGVFPTSPEERQLDIRFPNPLPEEPAEQLKEAQLKKDLGVPAADILKELGYEPADFEPTAE
ncbi:MAG TPA: phage portal protein [Anaerohalosphaeraceae bacterium]|nr:phage portal protein [Anaerohalosphaeraceae bacterium]